MANGDPISTPTPTPADDSIRIDQPVTAPAQTNETLLHLKSETIQSLKDLGYSDQQIPNFNLHDVSQIVTNKVKAPVSEAVPDTRPWYKKLGQQAEAWWTTHPAYAGTVAATGKSPEEKAAEFGQGVMVGSAPALVASGLEAPLMTATSVLSGLAGQEVGGAAGKKIGEKVGAPRLGEAAGATVGAVAGAMAPGKLVSEATRVRETGLAKPTEPEAESVFTHMNRETVQKLQDLGYSNQQITNFNITDIHNIVTNRVAAPPVDVSPGAAAAVSPEAPVSAPAESTPAAETPVKITTDSNGIKWAENDQGVRVSVPNRVPEDQVQSYAATQLDAQAKAQAEIKGKVAAAGPTSEPTIAAPPSITFDSLDGKQVRGPNTFGRGGGSFGSTVDAAFDTLRTQKEPDLQTSETVAPAIKTEGPEWDRTHSIVGADGKKVGSAGYKIDPQGQAQMYGQFVEPAERGKGNAQQLVLSIAKEAQAAGASSLTSDSTGLSPDAARVWEALKAKGLPVENITHPNGTLGYKIDFGEPAAAMAVDPQHEQALARRGQLPNQKVNLSAAYGETGKYVGGLNQAPRPGSEDAEDLLASETQSPLKEPYSIEVLHGDGTRTVEKIEAFSPKDAIKTAQKKFPASVSGEWSIKSFGAREPSTEYSRPTKKHLTMPASGDRTVVQTIRHELGHAMVGQNEGLTQNGMTSHNAPGAPRNMRAGVNWKSAGLFEPGTGQIRADKRVAVVRSFMGGIAADEVFNDTHRAANRNFDIASRGSDGQRTYQILRVAGFSREDAMAEMHKAIDDDKEYLTHPAVSGIIKENENTREAGLSRHYHYSPERLQNMHAEAQRRIQNAATTERPDDRTTDGRDAEDRPANVPAGESGISQATGTVAPEEVTTADTRAEEPSKLDKWLEEKSGYHPDLQAVVKRTRSLHDDISTIKDGATFIAPDGKISSLLPGQQHPETIARAMGETRVPSVDNRPDFLDRTGAVRTRFVQGRAGDILTVSVPKTGVTPEQVATIRQAVGKVGRNGNLILERSDVSPETQDTLAKTKEFASPADVEPMLREIGAHPDQAAGGKAPEDMLRAELKTELGIIGDDPRNGLPNKKLVQILKSQRADLTTAEVKKPAAMTPKIAQQIADAHAASGGSTFNLLHGDLAGTDNYAVSEHPERGQVLDHPPTAKDIQAFAKKNADLLKNPEKSLGTWHDTSNDTHALDVVSTLPDREKAVALGKANNQKAIFHLGTNTEIPTGGTGEAPVGGTPAAPAAPAAPPASARIPTVSTRVPTRTVKGETIEDHTNHTLTSDMDAAKAAPGYVEKMVNKIKAVPGLKLPEGGDANAHADAYIRHVADNIKFVHSKMTPEEIARDAQWYPVGAHERGLDVAKKHGITPAQAFGITSVESPMTDWDANTSLAERTADVWTNQQKTKFTPEMKAAGKKISDIPANAKFSKLFKPLEGKTLGELTDVVDQALWLRLYDEAHNPREYQTWNPDGTSSGLARNMDGTPKKVAWSFQNHIEKAIRILKDGSLENISQQLGYGHKVRNFFNNQMSPNDPRYLTIDTHAVNVGQLRPMSGKNPDVSSNFGTISNGPNGLKGTYPLHDAGYRLAAKELDIPIPSRLQSPVWTKIRDVFTDDFKTPENRAAVDAIWKEHTDGKITADQARNQIWDYAVGWNARAAGAHGSAADAGKLSQGSLYGEPAAGAAGRGDRGGTPTEDTGDTSFEFGANVKPEVGSFKSATKAKKQAKGTMKATDLLRALGGLKEPIPTKLKQNAADTDNMRDPDTRFNAARHEAAHAVVSEALNPGSVNSTAITPSGGVTDIEPPAGKTTINQLNPDDVRNIIATSFAGGMAEQGGTTVKHTSGDLAERTAVLGGRASSLMQGISRLATGRVIGTDQMLQGNQLQAEGRARVNALLADPNIQQNIDKLATHITTRGKLSGDEVRAILKPALLTAAK